MQLRTVLTQAAWNLLGPFDSESSYYLWLDLLQRLCRHVIVCCDIHKFKESFQEKSHAYHNWNQTLKSAHIISLCGYTITPFIMKDRSCTHSRSSRRCSIIMQINASRCHPKLTADHYETARGEKQNFLSRLIEQNNKDVLHLCFIGCFLRKMRLGYNSNSFVVNIMIDKLNETVWRLNFGHINVTMTRSRETHPFSWKV